jgi:tRNA A37 threonylcarbamoyladenosine synthetase subunit TsaC/SUA5/YrdC
VLEQVPLPLPTTSVNRTGEKPAHGYTEAAKRLVAAAGTFVLPWDGNPPPVQQPSTVIRINPDGTFSVLRRGALSPDALAAHARQVG